MSALVDQIAELHKAGIEIILVSSGAVASGRSEVRPTKKLDSVDQRQLFSAVGQAKLINRYYELFREHGIPVGQVLTMKENFSTRRHYLNQKNCMTVMLENGVIPIVNENDTISVSKNSEIMDDALIAALQNAFINIGNTDEGKQVIAIYSHNGYQIAQSSDYDNERAAQKLIQELSAAN